MAFFRRIMCRGARPYVTEGGWCDVENPGISFFRTLKKRRYRLKRYTCSLNEFLLILNANEVFHSTKSVNSL